MLHRYVKLAGMLTLLAFPAVAPKAAPVVAVEATDTRSGGILVGYGCKGAGGPLYALEEDQFPAPCADIHWVAEIEAMQP